MISFKYIRYKNFLSTGNVFTTVNFDKDATTLIVGNNGSGKSTILDALSFLLFGKAYRNINKPQLQNSINKKDCLVEGEFTIGTLNYKIRRGINPAIFEVFQNGSLLNKAAKSHDYQDDLEKFIIKANHNSFCQIVVLGSATFKPFMQLTKPERRKIIEDLLDLEIFSKMNAIHKIKMNVNKSSIDEVISNKKVIEEKIDLIKEHLRELNVNNSQMIDNKNNTISNNSQKIIELKKELENCEREYNSLLLTDCDTDSLNKKLKKLTSYRHKIEANLSILNQNVSFFKKYDICPTCSQPINTTFKCESILSKEEEIKKIEDGLSLLEKEYSNQDEKIKSYMKVKEDIREKKLEKIAIENKINSLEEYNIRLEQDIILLSKKPEVQNNNKLEDFELEIISLEKEYNSLMEEKEILTSAGLLLKDDGIKSKIIKQYIPIINKLINKYLSSMEFMCQFELNEEFKETIKSRYRDEFSYESFSEGEKMRINLAILFTWRAVSKLRNSINTNILIMDEVFDSSLDSDGTEDFIKLINSLTKEQNTFIISHKSDQLFDKFEKVVKFTKVKNFSRMETV